MLSISAPSIVAPHLTARPQKMANDFEKFASTPKKRVGDKVETSMPEVKRKKMEVSVTTEQNKNPVAALNELRVGLKYNLVEQTGPCHQPVFKIAVVVDGQTYYGVGGSKKVAKYKAAEEALKAFIQFPNNSTKVFSTPVTDTTKVDFTSDTIEAAIKEEKKNNNVPKKPIVKAPVMLLNELYPKIIYQCTDNVACPYSRFKITIVLGEEKFYGTGSSKKLAKNAAATAALARLRQNIDGVPMYGPNQKKSNVLVEDQERADHIGRLVQEKFASLMADDAPHAKRKVLAGIVMTRSSNLADSEVISVTTGTKCVSGEHISMNGCSLNDMHAEIVSRRCLISYFYDQLELLLGSDRDQSIFLPKDDGKGYRLKDGIDFHLYINTAPCGDARIFSPNEDFGDIDRHPNRSSRGQLRTKIESGEGTIPVAKTGGIQTWDGVLQGERLLTMSCSDKICRWNIVGLQGALLSHYLEPIYLKSIILGSLMRESHLYRAIYGRVESTLQGLPPPFRLNRPAMYLLTSSENRQAGKAPSFSVIWKTGDAKAEVINTNTGKPDTGISKVCKNVLMKRFMNILGSLSSITGIEDRVPYLYGEAKEDIAPYMTAKKYLYEAFVKAGFGHWISKPMEQDMFELTKESDDVTMLDGDGDKNGDKNEEENNVMEAEDTSQAL